MAEESTDSEAKNPRRNPRVFHFVRVKGLEPPRLSAPEPKSGASANFATPAWNFESLAFF